MTSEHVLMIEVGTNKVIATLAARDAVAGDVIVLPPRWATIPSAWKIHERVIRLNAIVGGGDLTYLWCVAVGRRAFLEPAHDDIVAAGIELNPMTKEVMLGR